MDKDKVFVLLFFVNFFYPKDVCINQKSTKSNNTSRKRVNECAGEKEVMNGNK